MLPAVGNEPVLVERRRAAEQTHAERVEHRLAMTAGEERVDPTVEREPVPLGGLRSAAGLVCLQHND